MSIREKLQELAREIGRTGGKFLPLPWLRSTSAETLAELLPNTHHAVISVWHLALPDERALVFLGPQDKAGKQRIRADLIHQLFPRATLLMERHRNASRNNALFSRLSIEVGGNGDKCVCWTRPWPYARLVFSEVGWNELLPPDFLSRFEESISQLKQILGEEDAERNWHHVVDAGRTLREEFANWLHFYRRQFGDLARKDLLPAVSAMADMKQVERRRQREFPGVLRERISSKEITWFVDSETIDEFVGLLQALRCYMKDNRHLVSWLNLNEVPHQALGVLAIAKTVTSPSRSPLRAKDLQSFYNDDFLPLITDTTLKPPAKDEADDRPEPTLPVEIKTEVDSWLTSTELDNSCAKRLVALAKELAEKHCVHEGRQLHYRFIYASSAWLWPEIEEVLSFEGASDHASAECS